VNPEGVALQAIAPDGIGEIGPGTDLAALVATHAVDGDIVVLTSKVVSKAEGRVITGSRDAAIRAETVRLVARRGPTSIVENHLGLIMAAAGVDASNVEPGQLVLLPADPDATARRLREEVRTRTGANVAILISDTAGRAWRHGQTDIAIGAAGVEPLEDFDGRRDAYGNELAVTAPAIADEITAVAELVTGKLGGRPLTLVRGLASRVLAPGDHGPGARRLVRELGTDMFGLGSREAVTAALSGTQGAAFGAPALAGDLLDALDQCGFAAHAVEHRISVAGAPDVRLLAVAFAHAWQVSTAGSVDSPTLLAPLS
jgi:coenzyme F420-0:L-glutamate ligase/coenzyme F420-1:gamma-L-glutamate ligase